MPQAKLNDISLYYEIYGKGKPLLLIAGLGSDNSSWAGVVKIFSKRFQAIVFDNRGAGRSSIIRKQHTIRRMADDAVRILDYLGIERAYIIGHSMGGYIAQEMAINYPDRVDRLVLESTAPVSSKRNNILFEDIYNQLEREGYSEAWVKRWAFWLFSVEAFGRGKFIDTFIKQAAKYPYPMSADSFKAQAEAIAKFDSRSQLSGIKAKTLIIEGEDDILIKPDEARALVKHIRGSVIKLIRGLAHCIHMENPALFTKAVVDFLER